jgi:hypothetical protein
MPGWRLRAREVIRRTIALNANRCGDLTTMIEAIDAAYPFGERRYLPYKTWLDERAKAIDELATEPIQTICRVCGAKPFRPCRDVETKKPMAELHASRLGKPGPSGPLFGET